jgi:hypothetical protein
LAALKLSGLALTENHYLVVGTIDPAGLLIFDLYTGGEPRQVLWPTAVPFVPSTWSRGGGGVWILDRTNRSYWALDRHFNVIGAEGGTWSPDKVDDSTRWKFDRQTPARTFPQVFLCRVASGSDRSDRD